MGDVFSVGVVFALFVAYVFFKTAVVVPQQHAFVVERLGKFSGVLHAGFHILVPFVDRIRKNRGPQNTPPYQLHHFA